MSRYVPWLAGLLAGLLTTMGQAAPGPLPRGEAVALTLKGMLARIDPDTTYISPEEGGGRIVCDVTSDQYHGIGVKLRTDPATKQLLVETPLFGGPAHRAGLQPGDRVVQIVRVET